MRRGRRDPVTGELLESDYLYKGSDSGVYKKEDVHGKEKGGHQTPGTPPPQRVEGAEKPH